MKFFIKEHLSCKYINKRKYGRLLSLKCGKRLANSALHIGNVIQSLHGHRVLFIIGGR